MEGIKTILRELSVIFGFIISKHKIAITTIDVETFINLIRQYCLNINECNSELSRKNCNCQLRIRFNFYKDYHSVLYLSSPDDTQTKNIQSLPSGVT